MSTKIRYTVMATIANKDVVPEYIQWLQNGHVQALVDAGALSAEISQVDTAEGDDFKVESTFIFPSREVLQSYMDGPALALREDGKTRWIDTAKVAFARKFAEVKFAC